MQFFRTNRYLIIFVIFILTLFYPFFLQGKLPIPSDALIGLYHPWRDYFSETYVNGYPYKNPLITDPVLQQYPYRRLAIEKLKQGEYPGWNPYNFSGIPLAANIQSAAFYPLNVLYFFFSDEVAWSLLVILQPILSGLFLYLYLRNLALGERACFLGAITFSLSGFMVAWLEWNTIGHVALWLPLILLCIDKLANKKSYVWMILLVLSASSSFLAGHLQTFLYVFLFSALYFIAKFSKKIILMRNINSPNFFKNFYSNNRRTIFEYSCIILIIGVFLSVQVVPVFRLINESSRSFDLSDWHRPDWFIPFKHLVQFIAPDFFGNPSTGNYYGVWNYGEFVGYVSLLSLLMAVFATLARKDHRTQFFYLMLIVCVVLATPNVISKIPYQMNFPLISTLQPSRILVLIDFCLAVLAAFGLDYIVKPESDRTRRFIRVVVFIFIVFTCLWATVLFAVQFGISGEELNISIAQRNLALPTGIFVFVTFILLGISRFAIKKILLTRILIVLLFSITLLELFRFFHKFTPFTDNKFHYPQTKTISFLKNNLGNHRFMSTDRRIFPPNVATFFKLQAVEGYDPLYLKRYGELTAAWTRNQPDISPAAFNRILTPQNPDIFITNLLGVRYILTLDELSGAKYNLVFTEGKTKIYENKEAFPRAFLVNKLVYAGSKQEVYAEMFNSQTNLRNTAVVSEPIKFMETPMTSQDLVDIVLYSDNKINLEVSVFNERILVLTDIFYPGWKASVNGVSTDIFVVDGAFRGIKIPSGNHKIQFEYNFFY